MIRITQTDVHAPPRVIETLAAEFAETGCASLPGFLAPPVLNLLLKSIETTPFVIKDEEEAGSVFGTTMFAPLGEPSLFLLHFILNREAIFKTIQQIADCPRLTGFIGRLHRTSAGSGHSIGWHDDAEPFRTVGMSINLSEGHHSGGAFELRDPGGAVRRAIADWSGGDAFLFRIGHGWQHRLTPVLSGCRTVGVGWFQAGIDWRERVLSDERRRLIRIADATAPAHHPLSAAGDF